MTEFTLIRSRRRTLSIEVTREGKVVVRAPVFASSAQINTFIEQHQPWIIKTQRRQAERLREHPEPDAAREAELRTRARQELPPRVAAYAKRMGLYPASVRITSARTRFGSCSAQNRLCFSWRLMDYPKQAVDYVVVHELAHIAHKNHGPRFWALVESILPDYRQRRAMLR